MEEKIKNNKEIFLTMSLVFGPLLILAGVFVFVNMHSTKPEVEEIVKQENIIIPKINPFDQVYIEAEAAYVKNLNTGEVLFAKNENKPLPLASITKIMTVLAARDILKDSKSIQIKRENLQKEGDYALLEGEHFSLKDLIDFTLVGSANDGAAALAFSAGSILKREEPVNLSNDDLFVIHMNKLASKIGMDDTTFKNETGLDTAPGVASSVGSAKDITKLLEYVFENEPALLESTKENKVQVFSNEGFSHYIENTNEIIDSLPNILSSKTGFTQAAGGNLTVIIDPGLNTPIAITVLGSSKEGRFTDVEKLSNAVIAYFNEQE